jgi:hypothetical protein
MPDIMKHFSKEMSKYENIDFLDKTLSEKSSIFGFGNSSGGGSFERKFTSGPNSALPDGDLARSGEKIEV